MHPFFSLNFIIAVVNSLTASWLSARWTSKDEFTGSLAGGRMAEEPESPLRSAGDKFNKYFFNWERCSLYCIKKGAEN